MIHGEPRRDSDSAAQPAHLAGALTASSAPALDDPLVWSSLVDAVQPASILVAIAGRMGELRQRLSPEDIWQEALLRAWQARPTFVWQGPTSFRRWLVCIAENCIEGQRKRERAQKRDAVRTMSLCTAGTGVGSPGFEPWASTTPSRLATAGERARAMQQALESLPEEAREVVRLRLFEDLQILEIAARLGLGESAVRHRFRKGVELFHARLRTHLDGSTT